MKGAACRPIFEHVTGDDVEPLLSILCITYNHAPFLRQCLDGFLIQETSFPVEIIVHDDASTDGTAQIVEEYARRYPRLIRPLLQSENQYSQLNRPIEIITPMARGRYIARCEGDDYWTDPGKLQRQVEFLEANPDYVVSGHDSYVADERGAVIKRRSRSGGGQQDGEREDLILNRRMVALRTMVYRNVIDRFPVEYRAVTNGDNFLLSLLGHHGKSKYHPEIAPACYRQHAGGVCSMVSKRRRRADSMNTYYWIYRYYERIGSTGYADHYFRKMCDRLVSVTDTRKILREAVKRLFSLRRLKRWLKGDLR